MAHDAQPADDAPTEPQSAMDLLTATFGGPWGIVESSLPAVAFVTAYTISGQDSGLSAIVALALGVVLTIVRLVRGETLQYALAGLVGVGLSAFVVSRTGHAQDFFLPSLLKNGGYALAFLVSVLVRWPLLGLLVGSAQGKPTEWRGDPVLVRAYSRASWVWVGVFVLRLAVQMPLYAAGAVVALGAVNVALGLPLFMIGAWLTWLVLRDTPALPTGRTKAA